MGKNLEKELLLIKQRNSRVTADKAWETSWARRLTIAAGTYFAVLVFLLSIKAQNAFLSALVPAAAYLLSTLSMGFLKEYWLKNFYGK
ncbi:hypothetical protein HY993_02330 [Candidatus Micrarchaeota archaeon]|nr:hypothetical protein [Candidatus Micrarchaeota archaeon]